MDKEQFEIITARDFKTVFALCGFELPFIPDLLTTDGFGLPLEQEQTHLLNQQIRFLRMFYPQRAEDQTLQKFYDDPPDLETSALELRFVAQNLPGDGKRQLSIFLLGRVSTSVRPGINQSAATLIKNRVEAQSQRLQEHIQSSFPLEYTLRPLIKADWPKTLPFDLATIADPRCTAEICKTVETERNEEFAYPFIWSRNNFAQLCKLLWENTTPLVLSISIQPDRPLNSNEKSILERLAVSSEPVRSGTDNPAYYDQLRQNRVGHKTAAANYYLRTLQKPLLIRIQVVSNQPIPEDLLRAVGEEISPTQDYGAENSLFGAWAPFRYCYPTHETLPIALDNFRYIKRDAWEPGGTNRLRYMVGATEANAAFRIPLASPYGIPGIETVPFNPFSARYQGRNQLEKADRVSLGTDSHGVEFLIDHEQLTRHALIVGATGSGKTTTSQKILLELWKEEIPFLVIEPVKAEYRHFLGRPEFTNNPEKSVLLFTFGDALSPLQFNPFEVPPGVSIGVYISALKSCFTAAFPLDGYMSIVLEKAIREAYKQAGWDIGYIVTGKEVGTFPTISKLCDTLGTLIDKLGYQGEVYSNLKAALTLRFENLRDGLLGTNLDVEQVTPWTWKELFERPIIIEIESVVDDDEKALLIAFIFTILSFYRKVAYENRPGAEALPLQHVTLIEEAHRLFANTHQQNALEVVSTKAKAINVFTDMLAEMRARGEGIIIAEQIPTKLAPELIKHPDLKIMHRITSHEDRQVLGAAMNFSETHIRYITTLKRGHAAVYVEGLNFPGLIQIKPIESPKSISTAQIFEFMATRALAKAILSFKNDLFDDDKFMEFLTILQKRISIFKEMEPQSMFSFIQFLIYKVSGLHPELTDICRKLLKKYDEQKAKV